MNKIRFFIDNELADTTYWDVPIPQIGSIIFLHDEPLEVKRITYEYKETGNDYNLISVEVEHMEDENF